MRAPLCALLLSAVLLPEVALGYGYTRDQDPLLKAFREAVRASRAGDLDAAKAQVRAVAWQTTELADPQDVGVKFAERLSAAHEQGTPVAETVHAWTNLVYLALIQKFHWNLRDQLSEYHRARARLEAARAYYDLALSGNVKRQDAARKAADPKARSRHEDIVAQFERARAALGSPGLFGTGKRDPDPKEFEKATVRVVGHLNQAFPDFARPGAKAKPPARTPKAQ